MTSPIVCTPRSLPREKWVAAAEKAVEVNPLNRAAVEHLALARHDFTPDPQSIAVLTTKYWQNWGAEGVHLTVGFLDSPPADLRAHLLEHMNAWAKTANVQFVESGTDPQVRISRVEGEDGGYWSYVGTDILSIPPDQPTMNLEGFTMETRESEFVRVVRHETGHTMGFPHEHMRRTLVNRLDTAKVIEYFGRTQGWSPAMVRAQILTPLEESSLIGTRRADQRSIMCYQIPGILTKDGKPILGGVDIDGTDYAFAARIYPKPKVSPTTTVTQPGHTG